jgi:hypothetical protein
MTIKIIRYLIYAIYAVLPFSIQVPGILPDKNIVLIDVIMLFLIICGVCGKLSFRMNDYLSALLMMVFCVMVLISGSFNPNPIGYIEVALQYLMTYVIFYLVLSNYKYMFDITLVRVYLYASVVSVVIIAIYYHLDVKILPSVLVYNETGGIFYRVGFTAVNDYAYILTGSIVSYILASKTFRLRDFVFIGVIIYGILLTGSRAAVLFLVLASMIIFLTSQKRGFVSKAVVFGLTLAALIFALQVLVLENRIFQVFEIGSRLFFLDVLSSDDVRMFGGAAANYMVGEYPIHINVLQIALSSGLLSLCIYLAWYSSFLVNSYLRRDFTLMMLLCLIFLFYQQVGHIYERNLFLVFAVLFFLDVKSKGFPKESMFQNRGVRAITTPRLSKYKS